MVRQAKSKKILKPPRLSQLGVHKKLGDLSPQSRMMSPRCPGTTCGDSGVSRKDSQLLELPFLWRGRKWQPNMKQPVKKTQRDFLLTSHSPAKCSRHFSVFTTLFFWGVATSREQTQAKVRRMCDSRYHCKNVSVTPAKN